MTAGWMDLSGGAISRAGLRAWPLVARRTGPRVSAYGLNAPPVAAHNGAHLPLTPANYRCERADQGHYLGGGMEDELQAKLDAAIKAVMAAHGNVVIKWAAAIEVLESNGERALWTVAPEGQKKWDTLGLLEFAKHQELSGE